MDQPYDYKLIIPGEPRAQKRHRSAIRLRRGCRGVKVQLKSGKTVTLFEKKDFFIHNYDPSAQDKADIYRMSRALAPKIPLDGPLRVDLFLYYSRPNLHYGTGRNAGKLKDSAPTLKATAPDRDNADKIILDALNKLFWRDDSRICAGEIIKKYSEIPRTEIYITTLITQTKGFHYEKEKEGPGNVVADDRRFDPDDGDHQPAHGRVSPGQNLFDESVAVGARE